MTTLIEDLGRSQTGWSDHCHRLAGTHSRGGRLHPAVFPGCFNDEQFIVMDRHRLSVNSIDTGFLTQSGADTTGEFRKRIGLQQPAQSMSVVPVADFIVPFRNQIVQWTSCDPALQFDR